MATFGALVSDLGPYQPKRIRVSPLASKDEVYAAREADVKQWLAKNMADINTPEFRAWFGASKVVGEDGRPLIQFHATDKVEKPFSEFALVKGRADYFYHFGPLAQAAERVNLIYMDTPDDNRRSWGSYNKIAIYAVFLSIQNPLTVSDIHFFRGSNLAEELVELKVIEPDAMKLIVQLERKLGLELDRLDRRFATGSAGGDRDDARTAAHDAADNALTLEYNSMMMELMRGWLEEAGYDGLKYRNKFESVKYFGKKEEWSYAALRSTQVKAVNNSGRWDAKNPNVFNGL